jgi:hypothetical protein
MKYPTQRLQEVLTDSRQSIAKTSVLVLGDGIHIQSNSANGKSNWTKVLGSLWEMAGGSREMFDHLKSTPLRWSVLVELWAKCHGLSQARAERDVRKEVCGRLDRIEAADTAKQDLFADVVRAGFANIVSFNLDWTLLRCADRAQLNGPIGEESFLTRCVELKFKGFRSTHVWFPYGDTSDPTSIDIDHSGYDSRLMMLEDYRDGMMKQWFDWDSSYSHYEFKAPYDVYTLHGEWDSWYDLFFLAPLVFVGVSLSLDDWPLWWLLHQRARNFVPFSQSYGDCPVTIYVTSKEADNRHLFGQPAGIEIVEFDSYDSMWSALREAFRLPPMFRPGAWEPSTRLV